jgi:hypothetical protein
MWSPHGNVPDKQSQLMGSYVGEPPFPGAISAQLKCLVVPVCRHLQIVNTSPCPHHGDWQQLQSHGMQAVRESWRGATPRGSQVGKRRMSTVLRSCNCWLQLLSLPPASPCHAPPLRGGGDDVRLHDLDHFKTQEVAASPLASAARTFGAHAQLACGIGQRDVD